MYQSILIIILEEGMMPYVLKQERVYNWQWHDRIRLLVWLD